MARIGDVDHGWVLGTEHRAGHCRHLEALGWIDGHVVGQMVATDDEGGHFRRTALLILIGEAAERGGAGGEDRTVGIAHVVGTDHAQLQRAVIAADDACQGHPVALDHARHIGNAVDDEAVAVLREGGVAVGVDGTDDGLLDGHAGGLDHVAAAEVVVDFGDGVNGGFGKRVACRDDGEHIGVVSGDACEFNQVVVGGLFAIGAHHVADGEGGGHRVAVHVEVDAGGGVLDVDVATVDEDDGAFHAGVFVVGQGASFGDGDRLNDGVGGLGNGAVLIACCDGHGLEGGRVAHRDGLAVDGTVFGRLGAVDGVVDACAFCRAADADRLGGDVVAAGGREGGRYGYGLFVHCAAQGDAGVEVARNEGDAAIVSTYCQVGFHSDVNGSFGQDSFGGAEA